MNSHFLEYFLYPQSVAIVGASRNPKRINYNLLANLVHLGFQGRIYPINPEADEILGVKTYPDLKSIPDSVDLAVVAVPYHLTLGLLRDCVAKGIPRVTIVAGGFSEIGAEGRKVQEEMAGLLRTHGIRAIGPNALSPINTATNLAISFHPIQKMKRGGLSFIFQSGLYEPRIDWLFADFNLYFNKLIDLGNKMDINEVDALAYLVQDPQTTVIAIHLESIEGSGRKFFELLREASRYKHVVVLKSGRTEAGAKAAASHTGVIVQGSDFIFDAALRQAGAIRAQNIEDFFDVAKALERFGSLHLNGPRLAIATLPGGEAVIVTDLCQQEGFSVIPLQSETRQKLRPAFPPWDISGNPFDLGVALQFHGGRRVYSTLLESLVSDSYVDAIAVQLPPRAASLPREFFQIFSQSLRAAKPIALWLAGTFPGSSEALTWLEDQHVPVFSSPEKLIRAFSALYRSSLVKKGGGKRFAFSWRYK